MKAALIGEAHNVQVLTMVNTCESAPLYVGDTVRIGIQAHSWTPAPMEGKVCNTEFGTYVGLVDKSNVPLASGLLAGNFAWQPPAGYFEAWKFVRICSSTAWTGIDQTNAQLIATLKG